MVTFLDPMKRGLKALIDYFIGRRTLNVTFLDPMKRGLKDPKRPTIRRDP